MLKDLGDAFNAAKDCRNVLSKVIIWESGVSKSQFYRIIKGKEAPSAETKDRICKSLDISGSDFDKLHAQSKLSLQPNESSTPPRKSNFYILAGLCVFLVCATALLIGFAQTPYSQATVVTVVEEEDSTLFIEDVTIPDGTSIPVNTRFKKTWRVQNTGNVVWKHRYLKRMTPASELICSSPAMVPIPETAPGEIIDITVEFKTPHLPGSCRTDWKTSDDRGNLYFPEMHGLFSIVTVVPE